MQVRKFAHPTQSLSETASGRTAHRLSPGRAVVPPPQAIRPSGPRDLATMHPSLRSEISFTVAARHRHSQTASDLLCGRLLLGQAGIAV